MKLLLAIITVVFVSGGVFAAQPQAVPGEYLIKINAQNKGKVSFDQIAEKLGIMVKSQYELVPGLLHIKFKSQENVSEKVEFLSQQESVQYITPNYLRSIVDGDQFGDRGSKPPVKDPAIPPVPAQGQKKKDPSFEGNYSISMAQVKKLWAQYGFDGTPSTVVAVIDTGIDYTHKDLVANVWRNPGETGLDAHGADKATNGIDDDGNGYVDDVVGYDFANKDSLPYDDHAHGTHVSGIVAATRNNGEGIAGVCAGCSVMGLKFITKEGHGSDSDAILALQYAVKNHANVINCSWGGEGDSPALEEAFKQVSAAGIFTAVAAGNEGRMLDSTKFFPARYQNPGMYTIVASDFQRRAQWWSNYSMKYAHFVMGGWEVLSSTPGNHYERFSGTSMASPGFAGLLGLLVSKKPQIDFAEMDSALRTKVLTAAPGKSKYGGNPDIVKAFEAVH